MSELVNFSKDDVIYKSGVFEMWMYRVVSGCVNVIANLGTEDEFLLSDVPAGEYFGQIEIIEGLPRTASVVAVEDSVLERIEGNEFGPYFEKHPVECMKIIAQMCERLKELNGQFENICDTIDDYLEDPETNRSLLSRLIGLFVSDRRN